jgi:hypothetical protein
MRDIQRKDVPQSAENKEIVLTLWSYGANKTYQEREARI